MTLSIELDLDSVKLN